MSIPRYIPVAEYVFGCCHYGHKEPYRTAVVKADSMGQAQVLAHAELKPSLVEHICHVETRPNPEHEATLKAANLLPA